VTPKDRARLRFVAWACVLAVLLAAASPASAGLPQAILAPAAPGFGEPILSGLARGPEATVSPDLVVLRGVAARAPPLA
jgi:hypothetical protein